jgi:hypothetical protein
MEIAIQKANRERPLGSVPLHRFPLGFRNFRAPPDSTRAICNGKGGQLQRSRVLNTKFRLEIGTLRLHQRGSASISWPTEVAEPNRHASGCVKGSVVDIMKKYLLLVLSALGLVALLPQRAKADGYFGYICRARLLRPLSGILRGLLSALLLSTLLSPILLLR